MRKLIRRFLNRLAPGDYLQRSEAQVKNADRPRKLQD